MDSQLWSWVLTVIGLAGFFLAGRKVWWCWYVNIANQVVWFAYAVITEQWGFLIGVFAYLFVFTKNAISWTKEYRETKNRPFSPSAPVGRVIETSIGPDGMVAIVGLRDDTEEGRKVLEMLRAHNEVRFLGDVSPFNEEGRNNLGERHE